MHRIDNAWIATAKPPAQPAATPGYFQPGNVSGALDATVLDYDWCNTVQEEIVGVVVDAGLTLDKQNDNQLALAIHNIAKAEIANASPPAISSIVQPPLGGYANGQLVPYGGGQFQLYLSSATFTVPQGVNSIRCRVVGAGGNSTGVGGGGGGEYAHGNFNVTPGTPYAVTVGTGTTSVGALISALPGGAGGASAGAGGTGGTGGNVRFAGGAGSSGGGAAGSVLGNGGIGGATAGAGAGSGGAVGGKAGAAAAALGSAVGGASPFAPGVAAPVGTPTAANGAPDAVGVAAVGVLATNAVGHAGTKSAGATQPRYWGETLTGGGGSGAADNAGTTQTTGGNGGDGAGGGSASNSTAATSGGDGGIFGGGAGGGGAAGGGDGGPGGGGGGGSGANSKGGSGWCVIEW